MSYQLIKFFWEVPDTVLAFLDDISSVRFAVSVSIHHTFSACLITQQVAQDDGNLVIRFQLLVSLLKWRFEGVSRSPQQLSIKDGKR